MTLPCINFSGYVGYVTIIFSRILTIACCSVIGLGLELGLDLVCRWLVVMHTYIILLRVVILTLPIKTVKT